MTSQSLGDFALRQTNVSNPSIVHAKPSQQSITASEDYFSVSGGSSNGDSDKQLPAELDGRPTTAEEQAQRSFLLTPQRSITPPETYSTPFQSSSYLPRPSQPNLNAVAAAQNVIGEEAIDPEMRKTPMRGEGKRRSSTSYPSDTETGVAGVAVGGTAALREGGIRRKPVPSTVMESPGNSPASQEFIDNTGARSSVARDLDAEAGRVSPAADDTPFIRFALDQLTRDEEVRGSRRYPGGVTGEAFPEQRAASPVSPISPMNSIRAIDHRRDGEDRGGYGVAAGTVAGAGGLAALGLAAQSQNAPEQASQRPITQWPEPSRPFDQRLRPSEDAPMERRFDEPNNFIPVLNGDGNHDPLDFLPGILRPIWLLVFILHLVGLLALLLLCAIWSLTHKGIFDYGSFGDSKYFLFEYLPTLLGMLMLYWLIQIQVAVYRVAPFIAMSSEISESHREAGALLPLTPKSFLLPYIGHFRAGQPVVGIFMMVSWLQMFSIPLLASSFNAHTTDQGRASTWRWIATAAGIWPVIGLYIILLISTLLLFLWLLRQRRQASGTGLQWDPVSLADLIVVLERSNALSVSEDEELRLEAPRLGYWRTSRGGNEVFYSYGIADKSARRYSLENGRIREKIISPQEPKSRFSDFDEDRDMAREQRHSREKMLPKYVNSADDEAGLATGGKAVPWFLKPSVALLWAIVAFVLLLAFLVVSYLPSTAVSKGFSPMVPAVVSVLGFSGTNFLFSFVPALLAMICWLGILDIDYAYRRLQPYASLLTDNGELAEKSLLLSYTADLPIQVTISALANGHIRVAFLSLASLLSITLPILGGGVFWAQFNVPTQNVRIFAHMPGYYALTTFVVIYALAIIIFAFPDRRTRDLDREMPSGNRARCFRDILGLVRMSRILDDFAFHGVHSKIDLVTRLLSASPAAAPLQQQDAAASRVSLADSVRGFGRARLGVNNGFGAVPRYALGRYVGRDGREGVGVDRVRQ